MALKSTWVEGDGKVVSEGTDIRTYQVRVPIEGSDNVRVYTFEESVNTVVKRWWGLTEAAARGKVGDSVLGTVYDAVQQDPVTEAWILDRRTETISESLLSVTTESPPAP